MYNNGIIFFFIRKTINKTLEDFMNLLITLGAAPVVEALSTIWIAANPSNSCCIELNRTAQIVQAATATVFITILLCATTASTPITLAIVIPTLLLFSIGPFIAKRIGAPRLALVIEIAISIINIAFATLMFTTPLTMTLGGIFFTVLNILPYLASEAAERHAKKVLDQLPASGTPEAHRAGPRAT